MKKDVVGISLQILLLLLMLSLSLPISASENHSDSLYVVEKEIVVSPGNTTIHYIYFDVTEGRLNPFLLFNITVSEPGWYHLEIWIDMFNPSDERWGIVEYVSENKTYLIPRILCPYLIQWPIDMIEFLITEEAVHLGTFVYTWGPCTLYLSAHEYRENAMYIIADFEAVKPGVIECFLWDTSQFFLETLINNEFEMVEANVTEGRILYEDEASELPNGIKVGIWDEDEAPEFPKFSEFSQPPNEFDIVVYANKTIP